MQNPRKPEAIKNVVLVHGAFVDGSGWKGVHDILQRGGFQVTVVQNPTVSLAQDVAATRRVLDALDGPTILVGHSYGGVVITEAGNHARVAGLVYVAAFAPDQGESVSSLIERAPPKAERPPILPPVDGFLLLDRARFHAAFAADLAPELATFLADSQVPWGVGAIGGSVATPAWKHKPSWYLLAKDDHMISPDAQRGMASRAGATTVEVPGCHAIYVSQPDAVARLIAQAAARAAD